MQESPETFYRQTVDVKVSHNVYHKKDVTYSGNFDVSKLLAMEHFLEYVLQIFLQLADTSA